jgi:hypothetical protein
VNFNVKVAAIYKRANLGEIMDWRDVISTLTTTYKMLFNRGAWPAAKHHKEDIPKMIQAMFSKMEQKFDSKLKQSTSFGNRGQGGFSSQPKMCTCHHCGQAGHIKPNCPQLKNSSQTKNKSTSNGNGGSSNKGQPTVPSTLPGKKRYEPPADNESHTKKVRANTWKWCAKCKRWNRGDSAHLTDEHKSKNRERPPTPPKSAIGRFGAISDDENNAPLVQSTLGYMARVGRTTHRVDISWCRTCNHWVHNKLESHCHSVEHNHGCGILLLQRGLGKLSSCMPSKDQAGQH